MKTTIFEQVQAQTGLAETNLEQFLVSYVLRRARQNSGGTFSWELAGGPNIERRLLLGFNESRSEIAVSFEVAYQLFACDTHFFVKKVGAVTPAEIETCLPGIVTSALEQVNNWKPTYEMF